MHFAASCASRASRRFARDGFVSGVPLFPAEAAARHVARLEALEARHGALHYVSKIHTLATSAAELATAPQVLDVVEALIGPDILLFDVTYIVKEPASEQFVSWHQDLTYWGFDGDAQVSMWLALTPATIENGCMRMQPGSHRAGQRRHTDQHSESNVLHRGQTVHDVDESRAVACPLRAGEASFHHGWTLHASGPNTTPERRVGLNVQYLAPSMRQTLDDRETAVLVRGRDTFGHFCADALASEDFAPAAVTQHAQLQAHRQRVWDAAT